MGAKVLQQSHRGGTIASGRNKRSEMHHKGKRSIGFVRSIGSFQEGKVNSVLLSLVNQDSDSQ